MKRMIGFTCLVMHVLPVHAACPVADALVGQYGITFSGFEKQIPRVEQPAVHGVRTADLLVIPLPNKKGHVPDGFMHSALIDKERTQAWVQRKGGFIPVNEWYGPVKLTTTDLKGCVVTQYR